MLFDVVVAMAVFAFVSSVTPGPNNVMLLASGVNFGFRRTIPHMAGINLGYSLMILLVALGIGGLLHAMPQAYFALKVASAVYMVWLAWKIAMAGRPKSDGGPSRPFTFLQAAAFQWINPKGWAMALSASAVYAQADSPLRSGLVMAFVFWLMGLPCVILWAGAGVGLRRFLADD
ncbi:MAG: LysE family translocator, partial [Proteobacteria bacterium]|nr:LysE family translocator [Pseudomonadota bacterium]